MTEDRRPSIQSCSPHLLRLWWEPYVKSINSAFANHEHIDAVAKCLVLEFLGLPRGKKIAVGICLSSQTGLHRRHVGGEMRIVDSETGRIDFVLQRDSPVCSAAWSPIGQRIAIGCYDGSLLMFNVMKRRVAWVVRHADMEEGPDSLASGTNMNGFCKAVKHVSWSPSGRYLAARTGGGQLRIIDPKSGCVEFEMLGCKDTEASWNPSGSRAAVLADVSASTKLHILNASTMTCSVIEADLPPSPSSITWSPHSTHIAIIGLHGDLRIIDTTTGRLERSMTFHFKRCLAKSTISWSPSALQIVIASGLDDFMLRFIQVDTGECKSSVDMPRGGCSVVAWGQCGEKVVIDDGGLRKTPTDLLIVEAATGQVNNRIPCGCPPAPPGGASSTSHVRVQSVDWY